jgi:hypothetical protein
LAGREEVFGGHESGRKLHDGFGRDAVLCHVVSFLRRASWWLLLRESLYPRGGVSRRHRPPRIEGASVPSDGVTIVV